MKLSRDGFDRARAFIRREARPLERALFALEFEGGEPAAAVEALAAFANPDGGFGHGLEPDLRLPDSSALATSQALRQLKELGASHDHPLVTRGIAWLEQRFDPKLADWRAVPPSVDDHPHADHWDWSQHQAGTHWNIVPRAEVVAQLHHWRCESPIREAATAGLIRDLPKVSGGDDLVYLDRLACTRGLSQELTRALGRAIAEHARRLVERDPDAWSEYCAKPLKLAPTPDSTMARLFPDDVARNLDWEIAHQLDDGGWEPSWTWRGVYPEAWAIARREWCGILTLETLLSLRAWGRL